MADEHQRTPELTPYQIHLLRLVYAGRSKKTWTWYSIARSDVPLHGERFAPNLKVLVQQGLIYFTDPTPVNGKLENIRISELGEELLSSLPPKDIYYDHP